MTAVSEISHTSLFVKKMFKINQKAVFKVLLVTLITGNIAANPALSSGGETFIASVPRKVNEGAIAANGKECAAIGKQIYDAGGSVADVRFKLTVVIVTVN